MTDWHGCLIKPANGKPGRFGAHGGGNVNVCETSIPTAAMCVRAKAWEGHPSGGISYTFNTVPHLNCLAAKSGISGRKRGAHPAAWLTPCAPNLLVAYILRMRFSPGSTAGGCLLARGWAPYLVCDRVYNPLQLAIQKTLNTYFANRSNDQFIPTGPLTMKTTLSVFATTDTPR